MTPSLHDLAKLIREINQQGWSPATSTNYSLRHATQTELCYVSRSGVDKSRFEASDFLLLGLDGRLQSGFEDKTPSAETDIHLMLYRQTNAGCILHTHSIADTLLSRYYYPQGELRLEAYELLKGIGKISTHDTQCLVPIFANTQNIAALSEQMAEYLANNPSCYGMLIERHGFYTWGATLQDAKRHLEVFQFLFECELKWLSLPK